MKAPGKPNAFDDDGETAVRGDPLARATVLMRPTVTWTDADGEHVTALTEARVIGSTRDAALTVADRTASRLHAELEPREDGVWVRDLGSKNGTFVAGVQVKEARVPDGGVLRIGDTDLVVRYAAAPAHLDLWPADRFGPLLGKSATMRALFARLGRVAASDSTVALHGETGTGKELVARAIHENSGRKDAPFVVVDCASIPETLVESELFGHVRGAFTGAIAARAGAFEQADGGTLFLDEIGELPLSMQPKLLRALESRTVRPLGDAAPRHVDVRIVSATHRDLRTMVNAGAFREDLYFRLAVLPVEIPPLRAHLEDVPMLVRHFAEDDPAVTSPQLIDELATRPWLGNVRELRNFVERARTLGAREALSMAGAQSLDDGDRLPPVRIDLPFREVRERWTDHLEREYLRQTLERHGGNISAVARAAGLDRSYVHQLIRKHGL